MSYYVGEDLAEWKGDIFLNENSAVEARTPLNKLKLLLINGCFNVFHITRLYNPSKSSSFQPLPDKEGKKCLFIIRSAQKSFEISASEKKKKQEWIQGENKSCFCDFFAETFV